jgi:hypothetical protein
MTPEQIAAQRLADFDKGYERGYKDGYAAHIDTLTTAVEALPRVHMAPNGWAGKPEDFVQFAAVLAILNGETP